MSTQRRAHIHRQTRESDVSIQVHLDGTGICDINTQVPFYDHMLTSLATHAGFDLTVHAQGDTHVDTHHSIEDVAIVLGQALDSALGDKKGIYRFGQAFIPMDEALAHAVIDISGRAYCVHTGEPDHLAHTIIVGSTIGYPTVMNRHVFDMIAQHAHITMHMRVLYGRDPHHITEAQYKALGRALRAAVGRDPQMTGIPSTKGVL